MRWGCRLLPAASEARVPGAVSPARASRFSSGKPPMHILCAPRHPQPPSISSCPICALFSPPRRPSSLELIALLEEKGKESAEAAAAAGEATPAAEAAPSSAAGGNGGGTQRPTLRLTRTCGGCGAGGSGVKLRVCSRCRWGHSSRKIRVWS